MPKAYNDPRARYIASIAGFVNAGSEPTSELVEACRDLNQAMAKWARRRKFSPVAKEPERA